MKEQKTVLLDGAMGTELWRRSGKRVPSWRFDLEMPEVVEAVHADYLSAGTSLICTNTFSANALSMAGTGVSVRELVTAGIRIARAAVRASGGNASCALDIGPLAKLMQPLGPLKKEEVRTIYREIIDAAAEEKPDVVFFETFLDLGSLRIGVEEAMRLDVPVFASMTYNAKGRTFAGERPGDVAKAMKSLGCAAVGLNCSLAPKDAMPVLLEYAESAELPLIFKPNAGLPVHDENGEHYDITAEEFAADMEEAFSLAQYIGGCCGTTPDFIAALKRRTEKG